MSSSIQTNNSNNPPISIYKPSELLGMFTSYLSRQDVNTKLIYLRGIYLKNAKHDQRWTFRYDILRAITISYYEIQEILYSTVCGNRDQVDKYIDNCALKKKALGDLIIFEVLLIK